MKTRFFLPLIVVLCLAGLALAQTDTARLFGTITDSTGAVIPNATVTATETATGRTVSAKTGGAGDYVLNALPVGKYHVEVKQDGFKTATADVALDVSQVQEISLKLETGAASITVDVTNTVPLVDTATSSAGEVIEGRQVVDLPLNGRNFTALALLTPGVSRGAYGNIASGSGPGGAASETWRNYESGGAALAVNGLRPQADNYLMDGLDNNESLVNSIVIFPAIEDIAEFKTTTNVAPAEFGRAGGAVVQVVTKSGSNQIHGSAYWFNRSKIAAADVFQYTDNPHCTHLGESGCVALPDLSRNQFGASLGGPIWKNKVFAFVDYQGWRQVLPASAYNNKVPTALMRTGNFTELLSAAGTGTATSTPDFAVCPSLYTPTSTFTNQTVMPQFKSGLGYVYNPQTCLPFGWVGNATTGSAGPTINIIPSANQVGPGLPYLNLFPLPNIAGANPATNDLNISQPQKEVINENDYDARLDFVVTSKDTVFARYSLGTDFLNGTEILSDSTHNLPVGGGTNPSHPRAVGTGWTHIVSNHDNQRVSLWLHSRSSRLPAAERQRSGGGQAGHSKCQHFSAARRHAHHRRLVWEHQLRRRRWPLSRYRAYPAVLRFSELDQGQAHLQVWRQHYSSRRELGSGKQRQGLFLDRRRQLLLRRVPHHNVPPWDLHRL